MSHFHKTCGVDGELTLYSKPTRVEHQCGKIAALVPHQAEQVRLIMNEYDDSDCQCGVGDRVDEFVISVESLIELIQRHGQKLERVDARIAR